MFNLYVKLEYENGSVGYSSNVPVWKRVPGEHSLKFSSLRVPVCLCVLERLIICYVSKYTDTLSYRSGLTGTCYDNIISCLFYISGTYKTKVIVIPV